MDIKDFDNMRWYKLYLPSIYIINWILMVTGPIYFPHYYQQYCIFTIAYLAFRSSMTLIWTFIGFLKSKSLLERFQQQTNQPQTSHLINKSGATNKQNNYDNPLYYHAFIIPNYNEDIQLLEQTLQQMASHRYAQQRYLIFLGMQDKQPNSAKKASKLMHTYAGSFKLIGYTVHTLQANEQRGKAANVSWCVQHLSQANFAANLNQCAQHLSQAYLQPHSIPFDRVMLTIIDADSWVPQQYIDEVDAHLQLNYPLRDAFIYQPCQMFTRNHLAVPHFTRTYDVSHGMVQFSNLFSLFNTSFPLSNYSLTYALVQRIGFWDTCADAIGQDFHTTIKAFWKTKGEIRTVSIFTPFNQLNIQTGQGYWTDVIQRFWQAQRHGRGCADAAYCLKRAVNDGFCWRTFLIFYQVLEITTLPGVVPWCMLSSYVRNWGGFEGYAPSYDIGWLFDICSCSFLLSYVLYSWTCRKASRVYYGLENDSWLVRGAEYVLFFIVNIFCITVPSATIGAFRVAFGNNEYTKADKVVSPVKKAC